MSIEKSLSERDIITKCILPAIARSGWAQAQIREEVTFTAGRVFVRGRQTKRGERERADIILYYKPNIPVAVVEAKDGTHTAGGMSVTYIFTENQFWLEGLDGLKMNYRYDKESDSIIYTEPDGSESVIEMSKLREVK